METIMSIDEVISHVLNLLNNGTGGDTYNDGWVDGYCHMATELGMVKYDRENRVWVRAMESEVAK